MARWGFTYVENLVWVKKEVNNKISTRNSTYFRKSKLSLLIFRKVSPKHVELRHQRTADVCHDFIRKNSNRLFSFFFFLI